MVLSMMAGRGGRRSQSGEWPGRAPGSSTDRLLGDRRLDNEGETARIAGELAAIARAGDVLALHGDLGAGKTAFARAFIRARGRPDEEVPSPTFTLVQIYEGLAPGAVPVWHFDLFRVASPEDALELGIEEAFASAVTLIEWPDRLGNLLPPPRLDLKLCLGVQPDCRLLTLFGDDHWRTRLSEAGIV